MGRSFPLFKSAKLKAHGKPEGEQEALETAKICQHYQ